jgi:Ras-related protein Rab-7A
MGASFYRNSECCALVCDLTDPKSFESIESWRTEFLNQLNPKDPDTFPFVLLGNKCDKIAERKVQAPKIKQYCETKSNMPYFETSAKDNTNVEAAFEKVSELAFKRTRDSENNEVYGIIPNRVILEDTNQQGKHKKCCPL